MHKVSAIIPAHNRYDMLKRAVSSVLEQTYSNIELIVVDDASTENLEEIKDLVEDSGQTFLSLSKNSGPATARNLGVKNSSGDFLAFLDSDDYWLPEKIEKQIEFHQNNPQYKISQCKETWYRNKKKVNPAKKHFMPSGDIFSTAIQLCCISSSSVFMEKSLYEEFNGYDENYFVCEDYDLWIRISAKHQVGLLEEALTVKYGGHKDQLSKAFSAMDRYRIKSLHSLYQSNSLSEEQKNLAWQEIQRKANILIQGAKKRGKDYSEYQKYL